MKQPKLFKSQKTMSGQKPIVRCRYSNLVHPGKLKPNPRNPNTHPEQQLDLYAKVIAHQGWRRAIVVSKRSGLIVTGHGAVEAARRSGWKQVPVDYQDFKSAADETAHMLADNKLTELSELDDGLIAELSRELSADDFDLELAGLLEDDREIEIRPVEVKSPPRFAWVLIGVPIVNFAPVQKLLDKLPKSAVIKTTQNDGPDANQKDR